jgi:hypothetical protein
LRLGEPLYRPFVRHSYRFVLLGSIAGRFAQAVAVEDRDAFDDRFGSVLSA